MSDREKQITDEEYYIHLSHKDNRCYLSNYPVRNIGSEANLRDLKKIKNGLEKEIQLKEDLINEIMSFVDDFYSNHDDEDRIKFINYFLHVWVDEEQLRLIIQQFNECKDRKHRHNFYADLKNHTLATSGRLKHYPVFKKYYEKLETKVSEKK